MDNPILYDDNSQIQRAEAKLLVPRFGSKMEWKSNENILDFGCGNGFVTKNILLPILESNFPDPGRRIYALDISEDMVNLARKNYPHPKILHVASDISQENQVQRLPKFDKVFSFYVLHWVPDLRKTLQCLNNLMTPNGEMGFFCVHDHHLFHMYELLSVHPKWAQYHTDFQKYIPKTREMVNPEEEIRVLLTDTGFLPEEVEVTKRIARYKSRRAMINMSLSINPFLGRIPIEMRQDYEDFLSMGLESYVLDPSSIDHLMDEGVGTEYEMIFVRARKF